MNTQREIIYKERNKVLDGVDIHDQVLQMIPSVIGRIVGEQVDADKPSFDWDLNGLNMALEDKLFPKGTSLVDDKYEEGLKNIKDEIYDIVRQNNFYFRR